MSSELLVRSIDTVYPDRESLLSALKSGKKLRIYAGIDPTATYVHLGHATNYFVLRRFHELGHKVIVLIGDFTAMVGDPSDKSATRKLLTREQVLKNLKTFKEQIGKILDFENSENPIEFRFNSEWLSKINFEDLIGIASNFTVQQMIERDIFKKRIAEKKPLYLPELLYPLMQGYDSVALEADVEVGGTDQTFNMLAGRSLVKKYLNKDKFVVSTTLLENPVTGEKLMSKSLGTGIGLDESSESMFGKTMALPDVAIIQCFTDCTTIPMEEIEEIDEQLKKGENPRNLKVRLAFEITKFYHSNEEAKVAQENFDKVHRGGEMPEKISELSVGEVEVNIADLIVKAGFAASRSESIRLIEQGGVKVDQEKITDSKLRINLKAPVVLQVGKLKFVKVKIGSEKSN